MADIRAYFRARIGKSLSWTLDAGGRGGLPQKREYLITPRGVSFEDLMVTVTSYDTDRAGTRLTRLPDDRGTIKVPLKGLADPMAALEDAARLSDPSAFAGRPRAVSHDPRDQLERTIAELGNAANLGDKDIPPIAESIARLRKFWEEVPGLLTPDLFSSSTGILRARWREGSNSFYVNFPAKELLGWSASFPRESATGMVQVNGRCIADTDIPALSARLGIRCTR